MSLSKAKYVFTNKLTCLWSVFYEKKTRMHLFIKESLNQYWWCYSNND